MTTLVGFYKETMPQTFAVFKYRSHIELFGIVFLSISLLNGCASDPPQLEPQSQSRTGHNVYRHKRAYNRPYRVKGKMYYPMLSADDYSEVGMASWYGSESGSKTSMGTYFRPEGDSAAHGIDCHACYEWFHTILQPYLQA